MQTLVFVYNADASPFALLSDTFKRIVVPKTYPCNLCMVTYGPLGMRKTWKAFLDSLPYEKEFLHRDEFRKQYPNMADVQLPAIFTKQNSGLHLLVSAQEINQQKNIPGLIALLKHKLKED
ncbi:MAG TPA: hypothetical protein VGA53_01020 [Candidatus Paceibacterota bacterium]